MRKEHHAILFLCLSLCFVLILAACGGTTSQAENEPSAPPTTAPAPTDSPTATTAAAAPAPPADTPVADTPAAVAPVADTPVPDAPTATAEPASASEAVATPQPLFYNLPAAILTTATGLYASPNLADYIVPVPIPADQQVFVLGRNATGSHLRVVWNTGVGWVPVSFTDYNGQRDKLEPLPIFLREPPACTKYITTQFGLNSLWTSDAQQRIAIVVDLFRSRYGEFPPSFLSLVVNGVEVESSRREIVEQGQFSLKDVVLTVPQDLLPGDTVEYHLDTSSEEPLSFAATIFGIPGNCVWDVD